MNTEQLMDFQKMDPVTGLVFPWLTHPALEYFAEHNFSEKTVLEWGGGKSTLWWATKAKHVVIVERNREWIDYIISMSTTLGIRDKITIIHNEIEAGENAYKSRYLNQPFQLGLTYDVIVVDDWFRDEAVAMAMCSINAYGMIIADNFDQDYVWDARIAKRLFDGNFIGGIFEQAGHKDHQGRKWKTAIYVNTPYPHTLLHVTNDYDSHRPMLWMLLEQLETGPVVEMGMGLGSTLLLDRYAQMQNRPFISYENSGEYYQAIEAAMIERERQPYGMLSLINNYEQVFIHDASILFIDSAPGEQRKQLIAQNAHQATVIVVHDTEEGAEHVYGMQETLSSFPYRCDLVIEGYPRTTAVSHTFDFSMMKGITLGKYKFI